jgi:hypothetical protein
MTRRVTPEDLNRIAGQLTALGDLMRLDPKCHCGCRTLAIHAHRVARYAEGAPGPSAGSRSAKGSHSDPTLAAVLAPDATDHWLADLSVYAHGASRFCQELGSLIHFLGTVTATNPRELTATGSGDCMACGEYCSGAVDDRLRAGYCNACRMAWDRAGRPDRFQFQQDRRASLDERKRAEKAG